MDLFTNELISNTSSQFFPKDTLSSDKNFLPEQVNLDGQWEVVISENPFPSRYVTEGKFMVFGEKVSETTEPYCLEPGLNSSITGILETMSFLIQEKNNHSDTCIRIKFNGVTQKIEV